MAEKKKKQDEGLKKLRKELEELKQQRDFCLKMIEQLKKQEQKEYIVVDELYNTKQEAAERVEHSTGKAFIRATKEYNMVQKEYDKAKSNFTNTLKRKKIYQRQFEIIVDNIELLKEKLPIKAKDSGRTK